MIWPLIACLLTIIVFLVTRKVAEVVGSPLFNPLILSVIIIISILLLLKIPYQHYFEANKPINSLLQPAIVALAFPLYKQLHQIRAHWKSILLICTVASSFAMISGGFLCLWLGGNETILASVLAKSVTTPIAMTISSSLGGIPSISAICVLCAGIFGVIFAHSIFRFIKVDKLQARGLSIGAVSHALGTARSMELNYQEGAYSSLALVLCSIITSILSPVIFPLIKLIYKNVTLILM